jgi:hypothetical protein
MIFDLFYNQSGQDVDPIGIPNRPKGTLSQTNYVSAYLGRRQSVGPENVELKAVFYRVKGEARRPRVLLCRPARHVRSFNEPSRRLQAINLPRRPQLPIKPSQNERNRTALTWFEFAVAGATGDSRNVSFSGQDNDCLASFESRIRC